MNFFKATPPIAFYIFSVLSFVFANIVRDRVQSLYILLLILGISFSVIGFIKRIKTKD